MTTRDHIRTLWGYLWPHRSQMAGGLWWLAAASVIGAVPPLYVGTMIDCLSGRPAPLTELSVAGGALMQAVVPFYQPGDARTLMLCCLLLVFAVTLKSFCVYESRWLLAGMSRHFECTLRRDLWARLMNLDRKFYVRNSVGDLMSRVTNDLPALQSMIDSGVAYGVTTVATIVVAITMMLRLSWSLSLWVSVPVPIIIALTWYFGPAVHRRASHVQSTLGLLSARLHENLNGVRVLRVFGQEPAEIRALDSASDRFVAANLELAGTRALLMPALQVSLGLAFLLALWRGGREVLLDELSLGTLVAFYAYIGQVVNPISGLSQLANMFHGGLASMARLNHILSAPHRAAATSAPPRAMRMSSAIELRHLTFRYPDALGREDAHRPAALVDISLSIPAGSTCAIVGRTGSGKSTLAALIVGFWEPTEGTLLIDGTSLADWPLDELRRNIGYVPQEAFLFSESLRDNIVCGAPALSTADVIAAATRAALEDVAAGLPQGYESRVGERGVTLSGGQKQRVALARALVRDPALLVLDDPFSSVDSETEQTILQRLEPIIRSRTAVIVSHRLAAVSRADCIVVLEQGRIVEQGTHAELLALGGLYAAMSRRQLIEDELRELC